MSEPKTFDTYLRIRGYEIWATEPNHYRHYHTLSLRDSRRFPVSIIPDTARSTEGDQRFNVGFRRPNGQHQYKFVGVTRAEADDLLARYPEPMQISTQFEIAYKKAGEPYKFYSDDSTGARPWGTTWEDKDCAYSYWEPLDFDLTEAEALQVIQWRNQADQNWFADHPGFKESEARLVNAHAHAAAAADLPAEAFNTAITCLECGAGH